MKRLFLLGFLTIIIGNACTSVRPAQLKKATLLKDKLALLFPDAEITNIKGPDAFSKFYQIALSQPFDHENPEAGSFDHYMYLGHLDYSKPLVIDTRGYAASVNHTEIAKLLESNQLIIEYRFNGKSRPQNIPWEHLNSEQANEDYRGILQKIKKIYPGPKVFTGISKGGETTLIYKAEYPKDVDVAVVYVAPLIQGQEDPRTEEHINTVGTEACRNKIQDFQRLVLENRDSIEWYLEATAKEKSWSFTEMPVPEAVEYAVLEFPFSFWQWGGDCAAVPQKGSSAKAMFEYVNNLVGFDFYSDALCEYFLPSYYQHLAELGYYGFDTEPVKDLLEVAIAPTNLRFVPKGVEINYDPGYIKNVIDFVETKGTKILYVYGGYDTWGACAVNPDPEIDALKMVLPTGDHKTRIGSFPKKDQAEMLKTLDRWLGN